MSSLSDRAKAISPLAENERVAARLLTILMPDVTLAIEGMAQANHNLAATVERMQLRIEELESQVVQLAPPKSVGPIVKPVWKPVSESDLPSVRPPGWGQ